MSVNLDSPEAETMTLDPAEGGKARWKGTTKAERSEAARTAAEARWTAKLPKATHGSEDHPLKIGEIEIPCYVLEDERRVLVMTSMLTGLDMSLGSAGGGEGDRLARFVAGKSVSPFVSNELAERINNPIRFVNTRGRAVFGYEATVLADLCEAVLAARAAGALRKIQYHIADRCEILVRGFARVGIIALVDAATGYERDRARDALAKILEAYIAKELRPWVRTFDPMFYEELFRIRGLTYPGTVKGHRYIGNLTNDLIYSRLAPGVLAELRAKNPVKEAGGRRAKHHQWLTADHGHPKLREHIAFVVGLMAACDANSWEEFYKLLNRCKPKQTPCPLFDALDDDRGRPLIDPHRAAE